MNSKILKLQDKYSSYQKVDIKNIYNYYLKQREKALLDSIIAASAVHGIFLADAIDYDAVTPQMEEAFKLSFPGKELSDLDSISIPELNGIISNWKGKVFELNIRDRLNSGEIIGDIQLQEGQYAVIADSPTQPGWDLQILNEDGSIATELQAKATDSLSYINSAFEKYPDIGIISTTEVAELDSSLINGGLSNEDLTTSISTPLENLFDTTAENIMESILPGLPLLIITVSEGRHVFMGKKSANDALRNGLTRTARSAVSMGIGGILFWLDAGILSLPTTFGVNYLWNRQIDNKEAVKILERENENLILLSQSYK